MGWKMLVFMAFVQLVYVSASVPQMSLVREWESVDVLVPGEGGQGTSRKSLSLYNDIYSLTMDYWLWDVYKDRLFVGLSITNAPFYLAYHNFSDTSKSLLLQPYPSWDAHSDEHGDRQIHHVVALRADRCNRLWVIDRVDDEVELYIIIFDLNTDRILRKHTFIHSNYYHHMVVDDDDCENSYVYINDIGQGGIWTYSWAEKTLWHHPGHIVTGMVSASNNSDYRIVYYNKEYSLEVWYISTRYLRDKTSNMLELAHRGGHYVSLDKTALDAKNNVLFFDTFDKSIGALPCWNVYERCDPNGWHDITVNTTHDVHRIILDRNGNLWALAFGFTFEDTLDNLSIFSVAITSVNAELKKNDTTNTTKLNETATPATDPASSTTVQSDVVYDGIYNTTATIDETTAGTPNSDITATYPAISMTEQTSGVDYARIIINTTATVTIEDTTAGTPNSDIATQAIGDDKVTPFANILFNFTNNTFILSNFTISYSPSNNVN